MPLFDWLKTRTRAKDSDSDVVGMGGALFSLAIAFALDLENLLAERSSNIARLLASFEGKLTVDYALGTLLVGVSLGAATQHLSHAQFFRLHQAALSSSLPERKPQNDIERHVDRLHKLWASNGTQSVSSLTDYLDGVLDAKQEPIEQARLIGEWALSQILEMQVVVHDRDELARMIGFAAQRFAGGVCASFR